MVLQQGGFLPPSLLILQSQGRFAPYIKIILPMSTGLFRPIAIVLLLMVICRKHLMIIQRGGFFPLMLSILQSLRLFLPYVKIQLLMATGLFPQITIILLPTAIRPVLPPSTGLLGTEIVWKMGNKKHLRRGKSKSIKFVN